MDVSLLPFVQVEVSWAVRHAWRPGDAVGSLTVPHYALWLVLDGTVEVSTADWQEQAREGTALLLPTRMPRAIAAPQGAVWYSVGFTPSLFGRIDLLKDFVRPLLWRPDPPDRERMTAWMGHLAAEWHEPPPTPQQAGNEEYRIIGRPKRPRSALSALIGAGLGHALFGLCWRSLGGDDLLQGVARSDAPVWLSRALVHIAREPGTTVHDLAGAAGLSPAQFRRVFHAWVGVSPHEHLTRHRLEEARRLLVTTDLIVSAVAEQVGFTSLSYFTRLFTRQFGIAPARWRHQSRQPRV